MADSADQPRQIKCPQCGHLTFYSSENKWRPFCSERCRRIDLGQWADEKFRVPIPGSDPEMLEHEESEDDPDKDSD